MLALAEYRASLCPGCSSQLDESTAAANEEAYKAEMRRCHACTAREQEAAKYTQSPQPGALLYSVRRR